MSGLDDLPARGEGRQLELQCPVCRSWRLAFLITETPADRAEEVGGANFVCDVERSRWARTAAGEGLVFDAATGVYLPDLPAARVRQRALINAARDAAQDGGCDTPSGRFDSAPRSREFLNGAALAATLAGMNSQPFTINWTLANNSVVTLDGPQIIAAGLAVAAWVDSVHQRAVVLKSRIDAAETTAAISAIVWSLADPA